MKILKAIILVGLPLLTVLLFLTHPDVKGSLLFTIFILFVIFERVWEGLYTSKDKNPDKIEGDWTLPASTISYIALVVFCLLEFYYARRAPNLTVSLVAFCVYCCSIGLRLWSIKSLGDQWSVHIIGSDKLSGNRHLVSRGPYGYIRHPVYLGIILEQISIPLVANLYYTAILAVIFAIPFQVVKATLEEKEMTRKLGEVYGKYINETPRFNIFKKMWCR